MYPATFDPVLDHQALSRLRLLKPLRPPEPGVALVLVPHDGAPLVIRHGEAIPDARYGTYHRMYRVDVTEHRLALTLPLLSRDPNFAFRARVTLTCGVEDPAEVLARGIRDVTAALADTLKRVLRQVSRSYDIVEFHDAERALNDVMRKLPSDRALRSSDPHVELLIDEDEALTSGRRIRDLARDTRLAKITRERHLEMMHEHGAEGLLAEIVEREGPRAALEWIASAEATERAELMKVLNAVMGHAGAEREPFDAHRAERMVLDRLTGGSTAPFGGTRGSRVRGTLASAGPPGGEPGPEPGGAAAPYPPDPRELPEASPSGGARTVPPDDEPIEPGADETGGSPGEAPVRRSRVRGVPRPDEER